MSVEMENNSSNCCSLTNQYVSYSQADTLFPPAGDRAFAVRAPWLLNDLGNTLHLISVFIMLIYVIHYIYIHFFFFTLTKQIFYD